jgi:hypothetical protein
VWNDEKKKLSSQSYLDEKNKAGGIILPDFKIPHNCNNQNIMAMA